MGWSNVILDPTLAFNRAQLGFRIQVGAECGNNEIILKLDTKMCKILAEDAFLFSYFYILKLFTFIQLTMSGINIVLVVL